MFLEYVEYFRRLSGPFLKGQTAIVSGADDPVGLAVSRGLLAAGARVIMGFHRYPDRIADARLSGNYEICRADASDPEQAEKMFTAALTGRGQLDILINNPTLNDPAGIDDMKDERITAMLDDAVRAALHTCRLAAPHMRRQQTGRIINMGHFTAKCGSPRRGAHFAAGRSALLGITKELTSELFRDGITVNAVAPGAITGCAAPEGDISLAHIPLGREGTPEEAAAPVLFLCSEQANFITGACIDVNGGAYMD